MSGSAANRARLATPPGALDVLVVDAGHHFKISLAILRCLSRWPGMRVHVLSKGPWPPARVSRHLTSFMQVPGDEAGWLEGIERVARARGIDVLLPASEPGVRLLAQHRARLERVAHVAPGPRPEDFDIAVHKGRFTRLMGERDIRVPPTVDVRRDEVTDGTFADRLSELDPPFLLKPTRLGGGFGIVRFERADAVEGHLRALPRLEDGTLIVQQLIRGRDSCASVLCDGGRIVVCSVMHALRVVDPTSPWASVEFAIEDDIVALTERITRIFSWSGPANLDFLRTADGELYVLEFNGRYCGQIVMELNAGVNLPAMHVRQALGLPVEQPAYRPGRTADNRGVVQQLKAQLRRQPHEGFRLEETVIGESGRDPLPEVLAVAHAALRRMTKH